MPHPVLYLPLCTRRVHHALDVFAIGGYKGVILLLEQSAIICLLQSWFGCICTSIVHSSAGPAPLPNLAAAGTWCRDSHLSQSHFCGLGDCLASTAQEHQAALKLRSFLLHAAKMAWDRGIWDLPAPLTQPTPLDPHTLHRYPATGQTSVPLLLPLLHVADFPTPIMSNKMADSAPFH